MHFEKKLSDEIEVMHGEIKIPAGINLNKEAPKSLTVPPELEVVLKRSELLEVKSKLLIGNLLQYIIC